ncbi:uncharacterized protein PAN0_002c1292 [Moesziomyces antarcticus]|uniref:Uncharacterized protein n=1 Tax=Pseudozyma antarctica TaxID=84753 RepID=A0A5C3FH23_PSEA2|nr:uncharacterized protein PAN0_002c1292 [Moesziomyces antarcticus]GAK63090.1 conserved hypothetical protein [Moesziomyces antarcticus]SPO43426.1 uncharacterized protein PSANT_01111 [Moesziomyces antarcticus]
MVAESVEPSTGTASSSASAIPAYPASDIAKPTSNLGILNQPNGASDHGDAASPRPRVSLSYADHPRRDRSQNASGSGTVDDEQPTRSRSVGRSHRRSQSIKRSFSQSRTSFDAAAARTSGALRRSMSLVRNQGTGEPIDPMHEPRRSIGKRPNELHLAERDPHKPQQGWWKHARRAIPFAAPYERSGVVIDQPASLRDWIVPGPLTFGYGQWWYLVFGQSIVAAIISGAINFGVAVALYRTQPTINIWTFDRQTVAGDMGVTVIVQQIVSFIITSSLVHHDLYAGPIGPLRRPWPPLLHLPSTPVPQGHWLGIRMPEDVEREHTQCRMGRAEGKSKLNGWWWWFVRAVLTGSERNDLLAAGISWRQRLERLAWTAAQGFFLCCLTFWWYWPLAIAIVAPIYEHRELAGTWVPMIIKLLYGAILSLLTNPIMALMAMGAESSVRRCYPELPMWDPFGGKEDFAQWKVEHGVVDAAELGEAGADGADTPDARDTASHSQDQSPSSSEEQGRADAALIQPSAKPEMVAVSEKPTSGYQSSNLLERRITEEPGAVHAHEAHSEKRD